MKYNQLLLTQEGKTLEFKRDLSASENIMKTLVAFANTARHPTHKQQLLENLMPDRCSKILHDAQELQKWIILKL